MMTILSLTLAALTQIATAVPHENGVFDAHFDDNGVQVVNRVGNITAPPENWKNSNERRADSAKFLERRKKTKAAHTVCKADGAILAANDIDVAQYALSTTCDLEVSSGKGDQFIPKGSWRYSVQNGVVAYVCNFASKSQHCLQDEVISDLDHVQSDCMNTEGQSTQDDHLRDILLIAPPAGYYNHPDWAKGYGYALWRDTDDHKDLCPNSKKNA